MSDGGISSVGVDLRCAISSRSMPLIFFYGWCVSTLFLWGLAFYEAPAATPDWLLRAQAACFGRTENGLPDSAGWMLLILGPATMLMSFLVAFGADLRASLRAPTVVSCSILWVFASLAVLEGAWVVTRVAAAERVASASFAPLDSALFPADYPASREPAPGFTLLSQTGERISLERFHGRVVLLGFVFAHCQTVCPVLLRTLQNAHRELGARDFVLLLVTLDPRRDPPSALSSLAARYELGPEQYLLSGGVDEVEAMAAAYGVGAIRDQKTGDVSHPPLMYVLSPAGERGYALLNPPVSWVVEGARRLLSEETASP